MRGVVGETKAPSLTCRTPTRPANGARISVLAICAHWVLRWGFEDGQLRGGAVVFLLADRLARQKVVHPLLDRVGEKDAGVDFAEFRLKVAVIEFEQKISGGHGAAFLDVDFHQTAREFGNESDGLIRPQGADRGERLGERSVFDDVGFRDERGGGRSAFSSLGEGSRDH